MAFSKATLPVCPPGMWLTKSTNPADEMTEVTEQEVLLLVQMFSGRLD